MGMWFFSPLQNKQCGAMPLSTDIAVVFFWRFVVVFNYYFIFESMLQFIISLDVYGCRCPVAWLSGGGPGLVVDGQWKAWDRETACVDVAVWDVCRVMAALWGGSVSALVPLPSVSFFIRVKTSHGRRGHRSATPPTSSLRVRLLSWLLSVWPNKYGRKYHYLF